jgi:hypothetical protein
MITPSYGLTATERVLPRLALDFTTASLDARVTFTRSGNTATVTNSSGVIAAINADLPRFDFNPTTLVCRGLLIEEARTNALLNSLIDGTDLATQLVTVTAAARTLSFYGTGTVVLSGAHSATVVGAGAYPTRTTLTFTPIAGVLTLTVTGTVQFAQLELGAFATSYIPTEATAVTRNADVATMTGTNFSDWYNASEGTVAIEYSLNVATNRFVYSISDGTNSNDIRLRYNSGGAAQSEVRVLNVSQASIAPSGYSTLGVVYKNCFAYKQNSFAQAFNGTATGTDDLGNTPSVIRLSLGVAYNNVSEFLCGHIRKFYFYPQRLINAEVQAFSK